MKKMILSNPLQQKPVPPTSMIVGPFSELASASARFGGRSRIKTLTQNSEHSLRLWADWEFLHLGGRAYELLQLCGKVWFSHQRFRAVDDNAALERVQELVASTEAKNYISRYVY